MKEPLHTGKRKKEKMMKKAECLALVYCLLLVFLSFSFYAKAAEINKTDYSFISSTDSSEAEVSQSQNSDEVNFEAWLLSEKVFPSVASIVLGVISIFLTIYYARHKMAKSIMFVVKENGRCDNFLLAFWNNSGEVIMQDDLCFLDVVTNIPVRIMQPFYMNDMVAMSASKGVSVVDECTGERQYKYELDIGMLMPQTGAVVDIKRVSIEDNNKQDLTGRMSIKKDNTAIHIGLVGRIKGEYDYSVRYYKKLSRNGSKKFDTFKHGLSTIAIIVLFTVCIMIGGLFFFFAAAGSLRNIPFSNYQISLYWFFGFIYLMVAIFYLSWSSIVISKMPKELDRYIRKINRENHFSEVKTQERVLTYTDKIEAWKKKNVG